MAARYQLRDLNDVTTNKKKHAPPDLDDRFKKAKLEAVYLELNELERNGRRDPGFRDRIYGTPSNPLAPSLSLGPLELGSLHAVLEEEKERER